MYDKGVLVITINWIIKNYRVLVPWYFLIPLPVLRYYFSKVPSTGTAVLLRTTVPTTDISFADDTIILLSDKNTKCLFKKSSNELLNIDNWLIAKKLFLNYDKIKCKLFKTLTQK